MGLLKNELFRVAETLLTDVPHVLYWNAPIIQSGV
jgi:hypothetical protein